MSNLDVARPASLAIVLVVVYLAYSAISFYLGDVLHFALDYSEPSFGRLWPNRFWLLLHVIGGTAALFSGPFQLWPGLRRRHPSIHRGTGRVYVAGVFVGGAAAFYLSVFVEPASFGVALFALGVAWWLTVGAGFVAATRGRFYEHRRWMIRGYVVTFSFVTFRWLLGFPIWSLFGSAGLAVVIWLSWLVPLVVTEVVLRTRTHDAELGPDRVGPAVSYRTAPGAKSSMPNN